jgi:hypothetical protein
VVGASLVRIARQSPPPTQRWSFYTAWQNVSSNCAREARESPILPRWKLFVRDSASSAGRPPEMATVYCRWWDMGCIPAKSVA